jgi:signal transduction histidine kinase
VSNRYDIAEAGMELAHAPDVETCCALLLRWAQELTGASHAAVHFQDEQQAVRLGDELPAERDGWHEFAVRHPDGVSTTWTAKLWLADPQLDGSERAATLLVRQAGVGLAHLHSRRELARHERQQHELVEAGKSLSRERSFDGVLRRIVEHAMALTGARYGALGVLAEDGVELAQFITVGIDDEAKRRIGDLPRGRGILGALIKDATPLRLRRLQDDPRSVGFPDHHPPMESFLGVPIVTSRSVAGRIYLTEKQGAPEFSAEDQQLVETLASQAAIAIDNASLYERLQLTAAELEESGRHKSAFLANMSHELRSPLNTILGYTRLLMEDPRQLDEEQLEDLAIVRGSGEHLLALITELLDLQRIEAGRVTLVLDDEDLGELVDGVVASVLPSVGEGVELRADTTQLTDPRVRLDRTRVRQILLNLLGNALKFTEQGTVELLVRDEGDRIHLEVRDTGPGIPLDDQARIFDSFFQSQAALDRTPGPREGAGLGLAITKLLVELHGGTVALHSTPGEGTRVLVELPRTATSPNGATA